MGNNISVFGTSYDIIKWSFGGILKPSSPISKPNYIAKLAVASFVLFVGWRVIKPISRATSKTIQGVTRSVNKKIERVVIRKFQEKRRDYCKQLETEIKDGCKGLSFKELTVNADVLDKLIQLSSAEEGEALMRNLRDFASIDHPTEEQKVLLSGQIHAFITRNFTENKIKVFADMIYLLRPNFIQIITREGMGRMLGGFFLKLVTPAGVKQFLDLLLKTNDVNWPEKLVAALKSSGSLDFCVDYCMISAMKHMRV